MGEQDKGSKGLRSPPLCVKEQEENCQSPVNYDLGQNIHLHEVPTS